MLAIPRFLTGSRKKNNPDKSVYEHKTHQRDERIVGQRLEESKRREKSNRKDQNHLLSGITTKVDRKFFCVN